MSQSTESAVRRADHVPADARVRHFDELDERTQEFFLSAADDGRVPAGPGLTRGEIIVFTDYYQVQ